MAPTVTDIMKSMQTLAPRDLAENWDNVGLQLGDPGWPVEKIYLALDPLPQVVDEAISAGAQMLITHHPLLFKPISSLSLDTPLGKTIYRALSNRLAIFSAHTNLDSVRGGVNDALAARLGLENLKVLSHENQARMVKLVVFVPETHEKQVIASLVDAGAGRIGSYSGCTFTGRGEGRFTPGPESRPYQGMPGRSHQIAEARIETRVPQEHLNAVLSALKNVHPYETPALDIYPVQPEATGEGLGRVGELKISQSLDEFADAVKCELKLASIRVVGDGSMPVGRVAICSGSGGGLLEAVFATGAQVYVSGDLRYHEAREAEARGIGLIDVGHFAGEHLILYPLAEKLKAALDDAGWQISIQVSGQEKDPFRVC